MKVGCAVFYKGKLLTTGHSTNKTHPLQFEYNKIRDFDRTGKCCIDKAHAEMMALARLKKMKVKMSDVTFYVARICKSRPYAMARPCKACYQALLEAGVRDIRYMTDYGYSREWIEIKESG